MFLWNHVPNGGSGKWKRRAGVILAVTAASWAMTFSHVSGTLRVSAAKENALADAEARKRAMEAEKKKTDQKIKQLEGLRGNTEQYVKELDAQTSQIADEMDKLDREVQEKQSEIDETSVELAAAEAAEKEQYAAMKLRIRYMYEKGDSSFLEILLSSDSLSDLLNKAEYIEQISKYDRDQMEEYEATTRRIAEDKEKLERDLTEIVDMRNETAAKQTSIKTLMETKKNELTNLAAQIGQQRDASSGMASDIAAQQAEIDKIQEEIRQAAIAAEKAAQEAARRQAEAEEAARKKQEQQAKNDAKSVDAPTEADGKKTETKVETKNGNTSSKGTMTKGSGSLSWPLSTSGRITSTFGQRESPTAGASTNHKGVDIAVSSGTPIKAADGGTVVTATYSSSAGNYVVISHGNGMSTVYMHCQSLDVSAGDTVSKGETIAKVGSTGYSTGAHLHFGVLKNGQYVDPLNYVSQ